MLLAFNRLQTQLLFTCQSIGSNLVAFPVLYEEMEADACKKYQKRNAGNDTREAFGCFSLRAFFGALALFSVSLFGVFAAAAVSMFFYPDC